jgi:glycosyltransferase involved in cell wall biosynthesis
MKILFVQNMNGISGSELYLLQLLPSLKRRGIDAEMLVVFKENTGKNGSFIGQLRQGNIKTHEIYGHRPLSPFLLLKIRKLLKSGGYDIVQSNLIHADLWMALEKLLFFRRMKLVSVKHGFNESYAAKYGFNTKKVNVSPSVWVQRISGIVINKNVAISKGIYDLYVKGRISKESKTQIVYYGLNLDHIPTDNLENKIQNRYAIILGRLVKYKGHEYVIRAWTKVKEYDPSLRLLIVGGGQYMDQLVKIVNELDLKDQVVFCGYQPNPHQLLHFTEFSIVPSIFEGFGLIILESWHHKRPVIAFDVPALNEIINDNVTGRLVPLYNIDGLGEAIIRLFADTETCRLFGERGFQKLQSDYNLDRMTSEMEAIYHSLI